MVISLYIHCDSKSSHVGEGRLQTGASGWNDTPCTRRNLHGHTNETNADTDMMVIGVLEVAEAKRSVSVPRGVNGNDRGPAMLGDSVSVY